VNKRDIGGFILAIVSAYQAYLASEVKESTSTGIIQLVEIKDAQCNRIIDIINKGD
jgi:hypothetical protein